MANTLECRCESWKMNMLLVLVSLPLASRVLLKGAACAIQPNKCNRLLKFTAHVPSIRYTHFKWREPKRRERERMRESNVVRSVCVLVIQIVCFLLVASHWNAIRRLHTKFLLVKEYASHLPSCMYRTCWIRLCARIHCCAHCHTSREQEREQERERESKTYRSTQARCIVRCCLYHGCPKQKRIETQMYKNLSTLSQTNQSKLCCRRCSTYRHVVL